MNSFLPSTSLKDTKWLWNGISRRTENAFSRIKTRLPSLSHIIYSRTCFFSPWSDFISSFFLFFLMHESTWSSTTKQNVPNDVTRDVSAAPASSMLPCLRAKRVAGNPELETENLCHALSKPKFFPDLRVAPHVSSTACVRLLTCPPPCVDVAPRSTDRGGGVKGALTSEPSRNTNM